MPRVVSTKVQLERLTSLMEENTDLAKGLCPKSLAKPRWEKISHEVNSFGPPVRSPDEWQRVWNDLKYKTKRKSAHNRAESIATGGGPSKAVPLSNLEETVGRLMSYGTYYNPPGEEFGIEREPVTDTEVLSDNGVQVQDKTPKRRRMFRREEPQIALLERQTTDQAEFHKETLSTLKEIKNTLQNIETYKKKSYYLKKDKLALYKEENKNKREARVAKLEMKRRILELKENIYVQRM